MTYLQEIQYIWYELMELMRHELHLPEPIGDITYLEITMFWAVAFMLADGVSMIASRRD